MKATKLKSGSWRIQIYAGKNPDGKPYYMSFTHPDRKEAERNALEFKLHHKEVSRDARRMTIGEAIDQYIDSKDGVLSPSTIAGYKRQRRNCLQGIIEIPLIKLTPEDIQREINAMSKTKSPKYVRNAHGLLSAVLSAYYPSFIVRTTLPQKQVYTPTVPSEHDVKQIIDITKNTEIELPVLLALWLGLRMSEIRGITWNDVKNNELLIHQVLLDVEEGTALKATTKSNAGFRRLVLPEYMVNLINQQNREGEYIVTLSGNAIYKQFTRLCEKYSLPPFRFHDLRHPYVKPALKNNLEFFR